jgi:hypothetical protein
VRLGACWDKPSAGSTCCPEFDPLRA